MFRVGVQIIKGVIILKKIHHSFWKTLGVTNYIYRYTTNKNLTWLQKQQLKLKERREVQLREERQPHETRLLSELRHVQSRHMKPTASHRLDGYTSDTTAFADDDDDYTIPLHINTTQKNNNTSPGSPRTLSRSYSASKSSYGKTERPFMTVKRAHERYTQVGILDKFSLTLLTPLTLNRITLVLTEFRFFTFIDPSCKSYGTNC